MPISFQELDEQNALLSDPDRAGELTLAQLEQMRLDRKAFAGAQEDQRRRLLGQGMSDDDVDLIVAAQREAGPPTTGAPTKGPTGLQAAGFAEGAKQAAEGVADLAEDISVGIGGVLPEGVARTAEMDEKHRQLWKEERGRLPGRQCRGSWVRRAAPRA